MKYCENCGAELEDSAVFCDECGARVETVPQEKAVDSEQSKEAEKQENAKYDKIEHAAIAYNKAVDMLADNDCTTNYEKNYINDYSNEEYMEIYRKIHIPSKIFQK